MARPPRKKRRIGCVGWLGIGILLLVGAALVNRAPPAQSGRSAAVSFVTDVTPGGVLATPALVVLPTDSPTETPVPPTATPTDTPTQIPPAATSTPLSTATPTDTPTPLPTATPLPPTATEAPPTATPLPYSWVGEVNGMAFGSDCPCDQGDALNCKDFDGLGLREGWDSQSCYLRCMELAGADVHDLDRDHDGNACEWSW